MESLNLIYYLGSECLVFFLKPSLFRFSAILSARESSANHTADLREFSGFIISNQVSVIPCMALFSANVCTEKIFRRQCQYKDNMQKIMQDKRNGMENIGSFDFTVNKTDDYVTRMRGLCCWVTSKKANEKLIVDSLYGSVVDDCNLLEARCKFCKSSFQKFMKCRRTGQNTWS